MELISILRVLWVRRLLVGVGVVLAVVVGLLVAYRVHLGLPPTLEGREHTVGVASLNVLVDTPNSQVADLAPPGADQLNARTLLFANLIATSPLQRSIARRAGLSASRLVTRAPSTTSPPASRPATAEARRAPPPPVDHELDIVTEKDLPLIVINAQAPSAAQARRLANAAFGVLRDYVARSQRDQQIVADRRPVVTSLGRAAAADVTRGPGRLLELAVGLLFFGLYCAGIVAAVRLARSWRDAAAYEQAAAGWVRLGSPHEHTVPDTGASRPLSRGGEDDEAAPAPFDTSGRVVREG